MKHNDWTCRKWIVPATWLMRLTVGSTFVFSGFVKAIDPWGTLYKFEDYMGAMGLPAFDNLLLVGVFALCAYEFAVGIFLLTGCFRRSAPIAAMLMMAVMLPLTLWIAVADPVADCGCFGDAIVISNWTTFWKNVVLVAAIAWLIRFNRRCRCLIRPFMQWMAFIFSVLFIIAVGLGGYIYQPLIDFRPFPKGTLLAETSAPEDYALPDEGEGSEADESAYAEAEAYDEADLPDETDDMRFIYSRDGVEKSFTIDDELPDESDGWIFVRRETSGASGVGDDKAPESSTASMKHDDGPEGFRIWSEDGMEDMTSAALRKNGRQLLLLMPDLKKVSIATTWQINSLYSWANDNDINMIGVVAGTPQDIERWKDLSMAAYPLYTAEDTQIKMLARGNPAVVYLNDGSVVWKSTLRALDTEDFQSASRNPASYARDDYALLWNTSGIYLLAMVLLMFLSYLPALGRFFPGRIRAGIERRDAKMTEAESKYRSARKEAKR